MPPEPPVKETADRPKLILAIVLTVLGLASFVAGIAIIFWPVALIVGGAFLMAFGIFGVSVSTLELRRPLR